jgi:hypothetical protein
MAINTNTSILTPSVIAKETLMQLVNNLGMSKNVYREYKNEFQKVGGTVTIRKPNKFRATKTQTRANSDINEPSTSITVSTQAHVSWTFSSAELTLTVDDYSKRYIAPAAAALANQVDADLCGLYKNVYNYAGTPGTTPGTFKALGDCQTILDLEAAPQDRRVAIVNPTAHWTLADGLKGTFAPKVAEDIVSKGYLGTIANLSIYMDQNVANHTTGAFTAGATPIMNGATSTGATQLVTNGWSGSNTVATGDIFTVAGVNQVNPMSGVSTGVLRRFAVTTGLADTSADMTIPVTPTLSYVASGPYNNIDALPLTTAALSFVGTASTTYPQNLVFHPNAFALVTLPLEMPANVWGARESDSDTGISIRVVKQYDILYDEEVIRLDILYGMKTIYPELAVRLWG